MQYDKEEELSGSQIQHGHYNNRIYLMKLDPRDTAAVLEQLHSLASRNGYDRIVAKIPQSQADAFVQSGFRPEAEIPAFYSGTTAAVFMGKNLNSARGLEGDREQRKKILNAAIDCPESSPGSSSGRYRVKEAGPGDAEKITGLYRSVFRTYPFPIFEQEYILKTMEEKVRYFAVLDGEKIIALASTEMDKASGSVEMTDFATDPEYRRNGLALRLLVNMEKEMIRDGFLTAYTICRAISRGMNLVFAKNGYSYGGTLVNNTNISGKIESMNIWYKNLINKK